MLLKRERGLQVEIVRQGRDGYRHYDNAAKVGTLGRVNPVRLDFDLANDASMDSLA